MRNTRRSVFFGEVPTVEEGFMRSSMLIRMIAALVLPLAACATGKSSEDILSDLQQRLANAPEAELLIASEEQRRITRLRLEKLLAS